MAFTVATRLSQTSVNGTSHVVLLPDGSNVAGGVVVVVFACDDDGDPGLTWPLGWTELVEGGNTETDLAVGWRRIDGTEGFDGTDDSITLTLVASEQSNTHTYLVSAGHHATSPPEVATVAAGLSAAPNPPVLNPSGWDVEETLWIAAAALRFAGTFTAGPANYTNLLVQNGGDNNAPLGTARRVLSAASEDPGTFAQDGGSMAWCATTIAVRPAAAGATDLDTDDSTHGHSADAPSLTQVHALAPADTVHAQTADSPPFTQTHQIAAADATHAQTAGSPALTQAHELAPIDAGHAQTAGVPALTSGAVLTPDDAAHTQTATSPALTQVHLLAPAGSLLAQSAGTPAVAQLHLLVPAAAVHAHTAGQALVGDSVIEPDVLTLAATPVPLTLSSIPDPLTLTALED